MHHRSHSHQQKLTNHLLLHLHDTELWADYLPRIPRHLYLLAALGIGLIGGAAAALRQGRRALGGLGVGLGALLLLPLALLGGYGRWRQHFSFKLREQLLDAIPWRGDEKVLDVGCGNGLLLNGMAQRLTTGQATGIDLWVDHGGGGTEALLWKNARLEGIAERIEFREADAREMPFESATFDVVMSNAAMHHISRSHADFDQAMQEMIRVLKPGGWLVISDVTHMVDGCAARMRAAGMECEVKPTGHLLGYERSLVVGRKLPDA